MYVDIQKKKQVDSKKSDRRITSILSKSEQTKVNQCNRQEAFGCVWLFLLVIIWEEVLATGRK